MASNFPGHYSVACSSRDEVMDITLGKKVYTRVETLLVNISRQAASLLWYEASYNGYDVYFSGFANSDVVVVELKEHS